MILFTIKYLMSTSNNSDRCLMEHRDRSNPFSCTGKIEALTGNDVFRYVEVLSSIVGEEYQWYSPTYEDHCKGAC